MTAPSVFVRGFVHRAEVECNCDGGQVDGATCGVCKGKGTRTVGCGGKAEKDTENDMAFCLQENVLVNPAHVVRDET